MRGLDAGGYKTIVVIPGLRPVSNSPSLTIISSMLMMKNDLNELSPSYKINILFVHRLFIILLLFNKILWKACKITILYIKILKIFSFVVLVFNI